MFLGTGADLNRASEYVKKNNLNDCVELCGYVNEDDIHSYFSIADAFFSPMNDTIQDWARCPSKLYMYLPYKRPIITCKIGEPYATLGNEGLYYKPGDSKEMSNCMEKVINGDYLTPSFNSQVYSWSYTTTVFHNWLKDYIL